jgi:hypothetical protein
MARTVSFHKNIRLFLDTSSCFHGSLTWLQNFQFAIKKSFDRSKTLEMQKIQYITELEPKVELIMQNFWGSVHSLFVS